MRQKRFLIITFLVLLASTMSGGETFHHSAAAAISASLHFSENSPPISAVAIETQTASEVSLIFTGDINLGRCIARAAIIAGDFAYPFHRVADKLRSADITIGSLDGTISNQSPPMECPTSMNLIGPEGMVEGLQYAGFDVMSVATNHIKDCGYKGFNCDEQSFMDTLKALSNSGIQPVGGGENLTSSREPVIIERQGIRFAFLGLDQVDPRVWATHDRPGAAPLSDDLIDQINKDVASAKELADVVIVLPQWGTEYAAAPDEIERTWAQEFLVSGATLVIGNGPHIVQPVEKFHNGWVFYSLGNFVFDQEQDFRREGMAVQVNFIGSRINYWKILPVYINFFTYQPDWVSGDIARKILDRTIPLP